MRYSILFYTLSLSAWTAAAISLDVNSPDSIKSATKSVIKLIADSYDGTQPGKTVGIFDAPYYWWSSAVIWDSMIDYWHLTGDSTYNDVVQQALLSQVGPNNDYMPPNRTKDEGNDDQAFWASAALSAAERQFFTTPPPSRPNAPTWIKLATNVFDSIATRWDEATCNGGLRWQIFSFNAGYSYKNTVTNANFFQLAARLVKFTGNQTYADWANKSYAWIEAVGLLDSDGSVYDGADSSLNCSKINHIQWTEDVGLVLYGSALMYNTTSGSKLWADRISTILNHTTTTFFKGGVVTEIACEAQRRCSVDQRFFKGVFARDLARTAQVAPFTAPIILPLLKTSAQAAASVGCIDAKEFCGFNWLANEESAGSRDLGAQYSALQVIQSNLVSVSKSLVTGNGTPANATGGADGGNDGGNKPKSSKGSSLYGVEMKNSLGLSLAVLTILAILA